MKYTNRSLHIQKSTYSSVGRAGDCRWFKQLISLGPWFESGWVEIFFAALYKDSKAGQSQGRLKPKMKPPKRHQKRMIESPSTRQPSFQYGLSGLLSFDCSRQRLMAARFPASPGAPLIITHDDLSSDKSPLVDPELRIGKPSTRRTGLQLNAS
jgi:hypothetical protein